jgi:outer membrane lipoprotein SlyB
MKKLLAVLGAVALLSMGGCAQLVPAAFPAVSAQAYPEVQEGFVTSVKTEVTQAPSTGGAIVGALLGGILGHQVGDGRGKTVATALGALLGGAVGSQTPQAPQTTVTVKSSSGETLTLFAQGVSTVYVGQPVYIVKTAQGVTLSARQ